MMAALGGQLGPQNRLHPRLPRGLVEPHRTVQTIVVRHRHRSHPQLLHALQQACPAKPWRSRVQPTRAVQKRENAMHM